MADPLMYMADAPTQTHRQGVTPAFYNRAVGILLVALITLLVGGSLFWLQWSSQRGITLGYPKPNVQITSATTGTSLLGTTLQFSAQSPGRDINYTWVFGDGSVGTGPTVAHAFTANGNFTVSVTAYDTLDQSSTSTTNVIIVPPPPQASFTLASIYYGYVTFDASGSSADPSTSIANYRWDFGDGNGDSNGSSQEYHQYYSVGTYQVTLVITDATGQSSSAYTGNVTIS